MLEILYSYERNGLPPLPGYQLEREQNKALYGPDQHLHGMVWLIRAQQRMEAGYPMPLALNTLQRSLMLFEAVGNPLETARTKPCMARALESCDQEERAKALRREAEPILEKWGKSTSLERTPLARAENAEADTERLLRKCRRELDAISPLETFQRRLHHLVLIVKRVFAEEQAVLFRKPEGNPPECMGAGNLSEAELASSAMKPFLTWANHCFERFSERPRKRRPDFFLPLQVPDAARRALVFRNGHGPGTLATVPDAARQRITELLSQEVRLALYGQAIRESVAKQDRERERLSLSGTHETTDIFYHGPALHELLRQAERAATTDAPILIRGKTGPEKRSSPGPSTKRAA